MWRCSWCSVHWSKSGCDERRFRHPKSCLQRDAWRSDGVEALALRTGGGLHQRSEGLAHRTHDRRVGTSRGRWPRFSATARALDSAVHAGSLASLLRATDVGYGHISCMNVAGPEMPLEASEALIWRFQELVARLMTDRWYKHRVSQSYRERMRCGTAPLYPTDMDLNHSDWTLPARRAAYLRVNGTVRPLVRWRETCRGWRFSEIPPEEPPARTHSVIVAIRRQSCICARARLQKRMATVVCFGVADPMYFVTFMPCNENSIIRNLSWERAFLRRCMAQRCPLPKHCSRAVRFSTR